MRRIPNEGLFRTQSSKSNGSILLLCGWANRDDSRRQELPPQATLLTPVEGGGQGHQVGQDDGIATAYRRRQEEQRFLDVRR
jgi:hypothetical protein